MLYRSQIHRKILAQTYLQSFFAKSSNPDTDVGRDQMHQTDTCDQFEFVNHQSRISEDKIHLRESECRLENRIQSFDLGNRKKFDDLLLMIIT